MSEISKGKSQITCRDHRGSISKTEGFKVSLAVAPKHRFGVHPNPANEGWRVTELSSGWAIPCSDGEDKETAIENAERAIADFNAKYNAFDAAVKISKALNLQTNPLQEQ